MHLALWSSHVAWIDASGHKLRAVHKPEDKDPSLLRVMRDPSASGAIGAARALLLFVHSRSGELGKKAAAAIAAAEAGADTEEWGSDLEVRTG